MAAPAGPAAWFAAEHQVIMAAAQAADGFDTHALQLPLLLHPYLCSTGRWRDSVATGLLALAAARRLGDVSGEAAAHCYLGQAYRSLGNPAKAEGHLRQALTLFRRIDHPQGQGRTHAELQVLRHHQQRDTDALYHAARALAQYRIAGCRCGETQGLNNLGWCHVVLGDPATGLTSLDTAVTLQRHSGDNAGLAYTLDSVGYAQHCLGEYKHAIRCYTDAESLSRELGIRPLQAVILDHLGDAHQCAENTRAARRAWHEALDIYTDIDQHDITGLRAKLAR
jgi:tetratricopeptide (TPR) repeat protein